MIVLDVVLMVGIAAAVVGCLIWAICTQYRDPGCADLRIRRRPQVNVRLLTLDPPQTPPASSIAL
jgi:hypothetical protein